MVIIILSIFSYGVIFVLLAALAYRDLKEYRLPDYLNAGLAAIFIFFHIFTAWQIITPIQAAQGGIAGGTLLLFIRALANRFYQADALGLGDVKLMTAAGIGLGFPNIFMAISLGAFIGALHGLWLAFLEKKKTGHKTDISRVNVPAGVGLAIGIALIILYQFGFEWLPPLSK